MNNVKEIVAAYLKANKLDGLYSEVGECGCGLSDLMPCDSPCDRCEPAYRTYCPCCGESVFVPIRVCQNTGEPIDGQEILMLAEIPDDKRSIGVITLP